eukprot:1798315-Lingulodinium_polyedra.AAC.1
MDFPPHFAEVERRLVGAPGLGGGVQEVVERGRAIGQLCRGRLGRRKFHGRCSQGGLFLAHAQP